MKLGKHAAAFSIVISVLLSSCSDSTEPPNMKGAGVVMQIKRVTPACYKIDRVFGGCGGDYYEINMDSDTGEKGVIRARGRWVDEDALRKIIGEHVSFACYRSRDEKRPFCSESVTSLAFDGTELMHVR